MTTVEKIIMFSAKPLFLPRQIAIAIKLCLLLLVLLDSSTTVQAFAWPGARNYRGIHPSAFWGGLYHDLVCNHDCSAAVTLRSSLTDDDDFAMLGLNSDSPTQLTSKGAVLYTSFHSYNNNNNNNSDNVQGQGEGRVTGDKPPAQSPTTQEPLPTRSMPSENTGSDTAISSTLSSALGLQSAQDIMVSYASPPPTFTPKIYNFDKKSRTVGYTVPQTTHSSSSSSLSSSSSSSLPPIKTAQSQPPPARRVPPQQQLKQEPKVPLWGLTEDGDFVLEGINAIDPTASRSLEKYGTSVLETLSSSNRATAAPIVNDEALLSLFSLQQGGGTTGISSTAKSTVTTTDDNCKSSNNGEPILGLTDDGDFALVGFNAESPSSSSSSSSLQVTDKANNNYLWQEQVQAEEEYTTIPKQTRIDTPLQLGVWREAVNHSLDEEEEEEVDQVAEWLWSLIPTLRDEDCLYYSRELVSIGLNPHCVTQCELQWDDLHFMKLLHRRYLYKEVSGMSHPWEP